MMQLILSKIQPGCARKNLKFIHFLIDTEYLSQMLTIVTKKKRDANEIYLFSHVIWAETILPCWSPWFGVDVCTIKEKLSLVLLKMYLVFHFIWTETISPCWFPWYCVHNQREGLHWCQQKAQQEDHSLGLSLMLLPFGRKTYWGHSLVCVFLCQCKCIQNKSCSIFHLGGTFLKGTRLAIMNLWPCTPEMRRECPRALDIFTNYFV